MAVWATLWSSLIEFTMLRLAGCLVEYTPARISRGAGYIAAISILVLLFPEVFGYLRRLYFAQRVAHDLADRGGEVELERLEDAAGPRCECAQHFLASSQLDDRGRQPWPGPEEGDPSRSTDLQVSHSGSRMPLARVALS